SSATAFFEPMCLFLGNPLIHGLRMVTDDELLATTVTPESSLHGAHTDGRRTAERRGWRRGQVAKLCPITCMFSEVISSKDTRPPVSLAGMDFFLYVNFAPSVQKFWRYLRVVQK